NPVQAYLILPDLRNEVSSNAASLKERILRIFLLISAQGPRATTERGVDVGCRGHPCPLAREASIKNPFARRLFYRVVAKRCAAQISASSHCGCRGRSPCRRKCETHRGFHIQSSEFPAQPCCRRKRPKNATINPHATISNAIPITPSPTAARIPVAHSIAPITNSGIANAIGLNGSFLAARSTIAAACSDWPACSLLSLRMLTAYSVSS